jgi:hypothetical protein
MPRLLLKAPVGCRPCFPCKLRKEFILNYAAAVGELKLDPASLDHVEPGVQSQWLGSVVIE